MTIVLLLFQNSTGDSIADGMGLFAIFIVVIIIVLFMGAMSGNHHED